MKETTILIENGRYNILNEVLNQKLRSHEIELSDLLVLSHLKIIGELTIENKKMMIAFENKDLPISALEEIVHLNQNDTISIISELIVQSLAENSKLMGRLKEKRYILLGLLFYNCQAYNLLLVSMIFSLLLLLKCDSKLMTHTVEFIEWQQRPDGNYGYYNPLIYKEKQFDEGELYSNFIVPNTYYCKVLLKNHEMIQEDRL